MIKAIGKKIRRIPKSFKIGILAIFLMIVLLVFRWDIIDYYYSYFYPFGTNLHPSKTYIPKKYPIVGVDVSRYQQKFNWDKAQVINHVDDTIQLQFIIAKATEGTYFEDVFYDYHQSESKKHEDIIFGAYHFFLPDKDVEKQANHFVNTAQLQAGNLLPVIDIEQRRGQSNKTIQEKLNLFCNLLENKYGKKPILYSNKEFLINVLGDQFQEYPIWVAHYDVPKINMPHSWNWKIWQLTDKGSTFATQQPVDVNVINGGRKKLMSLTISD